MAFTRLIGITIATAGAVFLIAGLGAIDTPLEEVTRLLASTQTPGSVWFFSAGAAALLGGGLLALVPRGQ